MIYDGAIQSTSLELRNSEKTAKLANDWCSVFLGHKKTRLKENILTSKTLSVYSGF